jgi:hypothetical protein
MKNLILNYVNFTISPVTTDCLGKESGQREREKESNFSN